MPHLACIPAQPSCRFAEGITAMALKRACALSSATKYVLWSDLTLAQIAGQCGYSDGAHLHRDFPAVAGGIPPSVFRQVKYKNNTRKEFFGIFFGWKRKKVEKIPSSHPTI